jgi:putative SOS response-associated peptidase YedK
MCGRFAFYSPKEAISHVFEIDAMLDYRPRFNIAPSQPILALRSGFEGQSDRPADQSIEPVMLRWGLVPSWAKSASIGHRMINARRETVDLKPSFRAAFRRRRCVILADGFYEWRKTANGKIPTYITAECAEPFAMAGLWEHWENDGSTLLTCTIITTAANDVLAPVHDRMPVIFSPANARRWIDPGTTSKADLYDLMDAPGGNAMRYWEVGQGVNNPRNDDAGLIEPRPAGATPDRG